MRRSGPPARRTPLRSRGPLKRSPSRGRPANTRTKIPATVRNEVARRSGGYCEAAHPGCTSQATEMHHRLRRSQGGKHEADNLLHLCTSGHRYIHAHVGWAYEEGLLLRRPAS